MKMRINRNSIRFRTTRSEVLRVITEGCIEETVYFSPGKESSLTYALVCKTGLLTPQIQYEPSKVTVLLPEEMATVWAETGQVGIYATIDIGLHGTLNLCVEKDFACLDRSDADNVDTFPHPMAGAIC